MINKKGQGVFIAAIVGAFLVITFFLMLPILYDVITAASGSISQPIVRLLIDAIPFFIFIMICWFILKIARSE